MNVFAAIFSIFIGVLNRESKAQEASGVFAPSLLDYFAAPYPLEFQVRFETPFERIPTVDTTPRAVIQATTNGFYAQIYDRIEHPMNAGLREAAGVQWVNGQSFAVIGERPAFAFGPSIYGGGGINFARNSAADGMGHWDIETVTPLGSPDRWVGAITLLPVHNGPLIVFSQSDPNPASTNDGRIESIQFAVASDDAGHGPWKVVPSGFDRKHGLLSNFEAVSNRIMGAFLDEKMTSLYLAAAPAALDGSAWDIAPILTSTSRLSGISIAAIDGKLMISYVAERSDGMADLYLAEPAGGIKQGWESTRLGSSWGPGFYIDTALRENGGEILASYYILMPPLPCPSSGIPCDPGPPRAYFGVFISPAEGTERTWREFTSGSDLLFGRWSTLEGKPVKPIKIIGDYFSGSELGLEIPPEVHWRASSGPQLSITRGAPRYARDLGGAYDPKVAAFNPSASPEKFSLASADLNADNLPDLVVVGWAYTGEFPTRVYKTAAVSVLLGDGSGGFKVTANSPLLLSGDDVPVGPLGIQTGDLNGDGKIDVILALNDSTPGGTHFRSLLGDGTGALREPLDASGAPASFLIKGLQSHSPAFAVKSLNGAGRDEIIMRTTSGAHSYVQALQLDTSEQLVSAPGFPIELPYQHEGGILAADFNNDTRMDVAITSLNAPDWPSVTLLIQNPEGSFTTKTVGGSEYIDNAFMADLNNDGNADLLLVPAVGGLITLLGDGRADFERVDSYSGNGDAVTLLDVNGDGILDLLGGSFVQYGGGTGRFGIAHQAYPLPGFADPLPLFAADLNGDGRSDLVGFDQAPEQCSGCPNPVRVWLHPSPGTSTLDLSLIGVPGKSYELFWKQGLDDAEWMSLGQVVPDEYGRVSTFHQTHALSGFYRAHEVTVPR